MVKLLGALSKLTRNKILVAGDFLLDTYTIGKARRISPEAPVAVINVTKQDHRPGGAGNVVLNLISMGADVVALGRVGDDPYGKQLIEVLQKEGTDTRGLITEKRYATPVKNRIIADNQQIVRVDHETVVAMQNEAEKELIHLLPSLLKDVKAIAISDYGKGCLTEPLLQALIKLSHHHKIPVITDPKGVDFAKYQGSTLIKPNLSEAYAAAGMNPQSSLREAAENILKRWNMQSLMVTRSEAGISIYNADGNHQDYPVRPREVKDVTGAGDTVLAMLTNALASGLPIEEAAQLSNVAAGLAIERFGCARISLNELAHELLRTDVSNKVFDEKHLYALHKALEGKSYSTLTIQSHSHLTPQLFSDIRASRKSGADLIVQISDPEPDPTFVEMLASLSEVDFVILKK